MRKLFVVAWLAAPLAAAAWHYGPGKTELAADQAREHARRAEAWEARGNLSSAVAEYERALSTLPAEDLHAQQRLRLAQARAEIGSGELLQGQERLHGLLQELERDVAASTELVRSTRHALAESSYYAALLKRLDGAETDDWLSEAERARQNFRLLAEDSGQSNPADTVAAKKNLEATIKLEQMDLSQLQAAPKPKKCRACQSLSKRKPKNRSESQGQCDSSDKSQQPKQPEPQDARKRLPKGGGAGVNQSGGSGS